MSSEDKSRKTEEPTPHKLRESRRRGHIAKSREIVAAAVIISIFAAVYLGRYYMFGALLDAFRVTFSTTGMSYDEALPIVLHALVHAVLYFAVPCVLIGAAAVVAANAAQFGFLFASDPVKPQIDRINPVNGLKQLFSKKRLLETLKALVKITVLGTAAFALVTGSINDIVIMPYCGMNCIMAVTDHVLRLFFLAMVPLFIVISAIDFGLQKRQYREDNRMTKEELTRDHKDTEGDPDIKRERGVRMRAIIRENLSEDIAGSSVMLIGRGLVVGIRYVEGVTPAPVVTVIERGQVMRRIVDLAESVEIPLAREPLLCQRISGRVKAGDVIPRETFTDVARVLQSVGEH